MDKVVPLDLRPSTHSARSSVKQPTPVYNDRERQEIYEIIDRLNQRIKQSTKDGERVLIFPYPSDNDGDNTGDSQIYSQNHRHYEGLNNKKKHYLGEILDHTPGMWFNKRTVRMFATVCRCTVSELGTWMYSRRYRRKSILKNLPKTFVSKPQDKKSLNWLDELFLEDELEYLEGNFVLDRPWTATEVERFAWRLSKSRSQIESWETERRKISKERNLEQQRYDNYFSMTEVIRKQFARWPKLRDGEAEVLARMTGDSPARIETIFLSMYYTRKEVCDNYMRLHVAPVKMQYDPEYAYLFPKQTSYSTSGGDSIATVDNLMISTSVRRDTRQHGSIAISTTIGKTFGQRMLPSVLQSDSNRRQTLDTSTVTAQKKSLLSDNLTAASPKRRLSFEPGPSGQRKSLVPQSDNVAVDPSKRRPSFEAGPSGQRKSVVAQSDIISVGSSKRRPSFEGRASGQAKSVLPKSDSGSAATSNSQKKNVSISKSQQQKRRQSNESDQSIGQLTTSMRRQSALDEYSGVFYRNALIDISPPPIKVSTPKKKDVEKDESESSYIIHNVVI